MTTPHTTAYAAEPAQFSNQLNHFLKNVAIAGGFLLVAAVEMTRQPERPRA